MTSPGLAVFLGAPGKKWPIGVMRSPPVQHPQFDP